MASEKALQQARELLEWANAATDDPRRTRIDLLQVANYIARRASENSELRDLVSYVSKFLAGQTITGEDLDLAAKIGWPVIEALPGPASCFYAGLRLAGHTALRSPSLIRNFEAVVADVETLTASVRRNIEAMDPDWASALTVVAAEMAAEPGEFRSRLIAAAKDVQQLVTSDELPTWADFEPRAVSDWPPLTLGVYPILGGRWDEKNDDVKRATAGGIAVAVACEILFDATKTNGLKTAACVISVVVLIVILIVLFGA